MSIWLALALTAGAAVVGIGVAALIWRIFPNDWPRRGKGETR